MNQSWSLPDKAIGLKLKITTVNEEQIEGYLFSYDSKLNCLVLQEKSKTDPKKWNLRIIRSSAVTNVSVLPGNPEESKSMNLSVLPPVDFKKVQQKKTESIERLKDQFLRSPEGVAIFSALLKTYPCVWDEEDIIVMESIKLSPPYKPENLSTSGDGLNSEAIIRLRKLLEREHKKLSQGKKETTAAPAAEAEATKQ